LGERRQTEAYLDRLIALDPSEGYMWATFAYSFLHDTTAAARSLVRSIELGSFTREYVATDGDIAHLLDHPLLQERE
jgi:hypothetical protein